MEKINVAEILKGCPTNMELDCTIFDDSVKVIFNRVDKISNLIKIVVITDNNRTSYSLTEYGQWDSLPYAKCVIFPKGKNTWQGFQRPFKDGDILTNKYGKPFILKAYLPEIDNVWSYCGIDCANKFNTSSNNWTFAKSVRLATEEEKEKLFKAIKDNGYKWNAETKTLEKFEEEKFDITTLALFESKVLVRDSKNFSWRPALYGGVDYESICPFITVGGMMHKCMIPYEGNEHLLGTTNDCDEHYKTWK